MSKSDRSKSNASMQNQGQEKVSYKTMFRMYKVFGSHYKSHWKLLALAYSGLFLTVLISLLSPWPLKLILDFVILKNPLPARAEFLNRWFGSDLEILLLALVLAFIVLNVMDRIVSYLHKVGILIVRARMVAEIRERVFAHLQRLSLSFHESARSGDLIYRLTSDIDNIMGILLGVPQQSIYQLIVIISHVGIMLMMEWRLALIAFSIIPILFFYHRRIRIGVQSASRTKRSKESEVASIIAENVTAMALVQAYGREDLQQARFEAENRESLESGLTAMRLSKVFKRVSDLLVAAATGGVVYYGGSLAWDGVILPGTLVLFAAYLKKLYGPVDDFTQMLLQVAKSQVSGGRLLELVECDMVIKDSSNAVEAPRLKGCIEFRQVNFSYQKGSEVLKNLSFVIEPGETVALVGHSGAGKSTLVSLLLRFYDPQQGQILIDGRDIREFKLKSLRAQMTVVMQEAKLFNKTVRDNIGFGKIEATEEEIIQAARLAQAHQFIVQMPEGYDTMISEGGQNLSGGQKQRLNIARAIIRNTPILILDEPATALDIKVEAKIHQALDELTKGKTTFIIAHKFSTIARADKILVLEEGQLAAYGTHAELMRTSREYRELYELQFGTRVDYATTSGDAAGDAEVTYDSRTVEELTTPVAYADNGVRG